MSSLLYFLEIAREAALLAERLIQVCYQVIDIFYANRQADQRIADAKLRPFRRRHTRVRHDRRMIDEALDATQTFGK